MNERLKDIERAALFSTQKYKELLYRDEKVNFDFEVVFRERFAQLIIDDCLEVILSNIPILSDEVMEDPIKAAYGHGMYDTLRLIEDYFGVSDERAN